MSAGESAPAMTGNAVISSHITKAAFGHAWRDKKYGTIHATVTLGDSDLFLGSPETARAVAAACIEAAEALEALPPAEAQGGDPS